MRHVFAVFILIGLMLGAGTAFADPVVIATRSIDSSGTHPASVGNGAGRFSLYYPRGPILFEDFRITAAAVGDTFVADAGSDPDFAAFAERATNGRGNFIEWIFGPPFGAAPGGGGGEGTGSEWALFGRPDGPPDFRGFTLSSLTLHVASFSAGPASSPGYEQLAFRGTLSVLGTGVQSPSAVPEPASLTLFGLGAFGLAACLRRRKQRAI
jgi:PEP-CTERM motif-containing protein